MPRKFHGQPRKTHEQRVQEQEAKYRAQLEPHVPTAKELCEQAEQRAVAHQKAALVAEIRRQRAVGEALDLQAALDASRGGPLVLPAAVAKGDLTRVAMAEWFSNVLVLSDLARVAPDVHVRMESADRAAMRTHDMLKLIAGNQTPVGVQGQNNRFVIDTPQLDSDSGLTREEKIALVRRQLKIAEGA